MEQVVYFLIFLIFLLVVIVLWLRKENQEIRKEVKMVAKEKNESEELGKSLEEYNRKMQEKKSLAKQKILEALEENGKLSNKEVARLLEVSRYTIVRYFDELEEEGKVEQVGKTGQSVIYKKTKISS